MSALQLYTISDSEVKTSPAVFLVPEPLPLDVVAPALRCLYCERCGLFLGTFVVDSAGTAFGCAFAPARHCLCTLPSETLCALIGNVEEARPVLLARGRLVEAFASAGCDLAQAQLVTAGFFPLTLPVRAWLMRHLEARVYSPGRWRD